MKMINMGKELIETGARDAKSLTTDEFLEIFAKALKSDATTDRIKHGSNFFDTYETNGVTIENVTGEHIKKALNGEFGTEDEPDDLWWLHCYINEVLDNDINVGHGYGEPLNEIVKLVTIKEGLPGIIITEGYCEDEGMYSFAMFLYCDTEEKLRIYVPKYGNFFNRDTMEVIGEGYNGEDDLFILKELGEEIPKPLQPKHYEMTASDVEKKQKFENRLKELEKLEGTISEDEYRKFFKEAFDDVLAWARDYESRVESEPEEFEIFSSLEKLDSTKPQENAIIEAIASAINVI